METRARAHTRARNRKRDGLSAGEVEKTSNPVLLPVVGMARDVFAPSNGPAVGRWTLPARVSHVLAAYHYLGPVKMGLAWHDEFGVIVLGNCRSRRLPTAWLELTRWCIISRIENAGSRQWSRMIRALRKLRPEVTTIVSYSDPSQGHTGALYRACNWWWAPTWLRLRPPPTGNGEWTEGKQQSVKDRWIFPMRRDAARVDILTARDEAILKANPHWRYAEPGGVNFRPPQIEHEQEHE